MANTSSSCHQGDLLDQRKLHNSGLGHYFHHIEVMSAD
jgi:putative hydrolase of the HAD superfamily